MWKDTKHPHEELVVCSKLIRKTWDKQTSADSGGQRGELTCLRQSQLSIVVSPELESCPIDIFSPLKVLLPPIWGIK